MRWFGRKRGKVARRSESRAVAGLAETAVAARHLRAVRPVDPKPKSRSPALIDECPSIHHAPARRRRRSTVELEPGWKKFDTFPPLMWETPCFTLIKKPFAAVGQPEAPAPWRKALDNGSTAKKNKPHIHTFTRDFIHHSWTRELVTYEIELPPGRRANHPHRFEHCGANSAFRGDRCSVSFVLTALQ